MKKVLLFITLIVFCLTHSSFGEENINSIQSIINQENAPQASAEDDQNINKDEGYGNEDEEYYGAEGNSNLNTINN